LRKIFFIFLILTALLVFIFGVEAADIISIGPWINDNTTQILVIHDEYLPDEEIVAHFRNVQEQFGVFLAQVIQRNLGRSISIYTTDTTLDGEISLNIGFFPVQLSEGFLSNKQTSDILQAGSFHYFTTQGREVFIFPIDALADRAGLGGVFVLNTVDREIVANIIDYLEESFRGTVQARGTSGAISRRMIFTWTAMENLPLLALIVIICILFVFIAIRYILSLSKHSVLMAIEGYSKRRITFEHLLGIMSLFLLSFILISTCILIYLIINSSTYFWWMFIRNNIIFHITVLALFVLIVFCLILLQTAGNKTIKILAGNKSSSALTIVHFFVKYTVLVMIVAALLQFQMQTAYLRERQQADLNWQQSENVYTIVMRVAADLGSLISRRPVEIGAKHLFEDLSEYLGLFLINAHNFQQMGDGRYIWEWNATDAPDEFRAIHSLNGRTITINENYMRRHPVYAVDGTPAKEHLIYDPFVQNVLVPISLSLHEADIYQTFLKSFYFARVDAANFYNQELGQPLDDTPIEQLSINIIFVEDGARYFTYNPRLAATTHNVITDPIVVVDTLNIDASFYDAWLTRATFFESPSANPLEAIRPHVIRNNMRTSLSNVNPVFDLHAESIRETEENLRLLLLVGMALLLAFIFSIYTFIASYYEQHKYAIYLKRLFGYSKIRCNWHMLVFGTSLTTLILLLFPIAWYIITILVAIDILLIMIFNNVIGRKSFSEIVKGVH